MAILIKLITLLPLVNIIYSWELIKIITNPEAKCLEGSPPAFYFQKAQSEKSKHKYLIKFYAYGYCGHDQNLQDYLSNCYKQQYTFKGSSDFFRPEPFDVNGIMSFSEASNPQFYDWNFIVLQSCDQTLMQGYTKEPVIYKNNKMWFRGQENTKTQIDEIIKRYDLKNAEQIVINGCSTGGVSAALWLNYLRDLIPKPVKMFAVLDGALLYDTYNVKYNEYQNRLIYQELMKYANVDSQPIQQQCVQNYPNETWKCLIFQYFEEFIKVPIFLTQAEIDYWQLIFISGQNIDYIFPSIWSQCITSLNNKIPDSLLQFNEEYHQALQKFVQRDQKHRYVWTTNCIYHCMTLEDRFFVGEKYASSNPKNESIAQAILRWSSTLEYD